MEHAEPGPGAGVDPDSSAKHMQPHTGGTSSKLSKQGSKMGSEASGKPITMKRKVATVACKFSMSKCACQRLVTTNLQAGFGVEQQISVGDGLHC